MLVLGWVNSKLNLFVWGKLGSIPCLKGPEKINIEKLKKHCKRIYLYVTTTVAILRHLLPCS